jgi:hypothetical protein
MPDNCTLDLTPSFDSCGQHKTQHRPLFCFYTSNMLSFASALRMNSFFGNVSNKFTQIGLCQRVKAHCVSPQMRLEIGDWENIPPVPYASVVSTCICARGVCEWATAPQRGDKRHPPPCPAAAAAKRQMSVDSY